MPSENGVTQIYVTPDDDERQDAEIGDFRGRSLLLVGQAEKILEIGAGYAPLFKKSNGYDVKIVDHLPTGELIEKYRQMGVDTSNIEHVDFVYRGESIPDLVGNEKFKFVYASHVIEHSTDFVRFLSGCSDVIDDNGAVILLVPDKRFCFDYFQPHTDTAKVLIDYVKAAKRHSFESLYREEMQVTAEQNGNSTLAWWPGHVSDIKLMRSDPRGRFRSALQMSSSPEYVDAHEYFFTPATFNLMIDELNFLNLLPLQLSILTRARGCEFMAVLTKAPLGRMTKDSFLAHKRTLALRSAHEQLEALSYLENGHVRLAAQ